MTTSKKRGSKQGHADNIGPQRAAVWTAGGGWTGMAPSDVQLARQVKQTVWSAASSSVTGTRLDKLALAMVRNHHRGALEAFGEPAIVALLRRPAPGSCQWCAARILCAASDQELPKSTPALRELLGTPCSRCQQRDLTAAAAEHERALTADARRRRDQQTPTGTIWPAGQEPSGVVASARRAARKADRPFYGSRRIGG